ncbi:MAG: cytochrome b [Betaproteobacteria bacterium]|nr:cytochrome b [Betaproteobacteria bacterium]
MQRYTTVAITLHWLIALTILSNFALGLYMSDLPLSVGPIKLRLYAYHKWAGVTVFVLVLLRILWRMTHRPPPLPETMKTWERTVANVTHVMLYLLTLAVPLSGWLFSSAKGFQTVYFKVLPIPDLIDKNPLLADLLVEWHESLNYIMAAVVVLHVIAALKHHVRDRDDVLARMLPIVRPRDRGAI